MLAMATNWLSVTTVGLLSLQSMCFVFDSEEIKSLNFVVDILDQPVLLSETPEERTVQMYNRAGQAYSCLLPDTEPLLQLHREEAEAAAQHASVPSLLAPMSSGPCLQRTRDWWTYELCPMSEIRQYHMEGGQIVGKTSVLGKFESDYDWSQDDGRSRNAKQRYHSQTYVNGSDCDLTSKPRSAEVRYICEEGSGDALIRVDEPETCRYVLTVRTWRVCAHRSLAPPPGRRPQPVTCRPALSGEQMERLTAARLQRARREAERAARLAAEREEEEEQEEDVERMKEELREKMPVIGEVTEKGVSYLKNAKHLFDGIASQTKRMGNVLDDVIHSYISIVSELDTEVPYGMERLTELQQRRRTVADHHAAHVHRIQALFALAQEGHYHIGQIVKDLVAYAGTLNAFSEVMIGIAEESRRLKEFMGTDPSMVTDGTVGRLVKAMTNLSLLSKELKRFFADVESWQADLLTWETELTEPEQPGGAEDRPHGSDRPGAQTESGLMDPDSMELLERLLTSRLAGSEDGRASPDPEESPASSKDLEESPAAAEDPGESPASPEDLEDKPASSKDPEESPASPEEPGEDDSSEDEGESGDEKGSSGDSKKGRVKFSTLRALGLDKMVQISEIDREQRARIERAVKQKLGKVGLDTNGPEIKVRFLKFPDVDHLDKEHTLSEEEMAAFENALVAVMMGGNEALVEHEKHSEQAKNYDFSFDQAVQSLEKEQEDEPSDESPAVDDSLFTLV